VSGEKGLYDEVADRRCTISSWLLQFVFMIMMGSECCIAVGPRQVCNHPTSAATTGKA
jgi:hypothetical protein